MLRVIELRLSAGMRRGVSLMTSPGGESNACYAAGCRDGSRVLSTKVK